MLLVSILLAVLYTGAAIWVGRKLPDSISAMVYTFSARWRWLWTIWLWSVTMLICIPLIEVLPIHHKFVGFACISSLMFTGAMPLVKDDRNTAHYIFSISGGILSQLCVAYICPIWLIAWLPIIMIAFRDSAIPDWLVGKGTFLSEIICYVTIVGALFCA